MSRRKEKEIKSGLWKMTMNFTEIVVFDESRNDLAD